MEKKFDDDEWKKFLEEEYIKEADLMEEALFSDEDFPDMEMTDEEVNASFDRLMDRLKVDGVYREEPKEETAKEDTTKDDTTKEKEAEAKVVELKPARKKKKSMPLVTRHKLAKIAGFVVMCTLTVFAASMTSEANRKYFVKSLDYLMGNDTKVIIGNDEQNEDPEMNEFNAKEEIENKLGVAMPEFLYYPESFIFKDYKISGLRTYAYMEYYYGNNIVAFLIRKYDEKDKSVNYSLHGEEVDKLELKNEDIPVTIIKVQDEQDFIPNYVAEWDRKGVFYQISGKIEEEQLKYLVNNIRFFSDFS